MLKAKYGDAWEEYLFKDDTNKKHVAKIPKDFAETIKNNLMKMRKVKKKQIIYENGVEKVIEVEYNRW